MEGWISIYRQILQNPTVCKDKDSFCIWMYLLLNATHKGYDIMWSGERKHLIPGQLVTSRKSISKFWDISESKVQRILKVFENEHQIEQLTNCHSRVITILNWNEYQKNEQHFEHQVNSNRTPSEHLVNTNNNVNKDNNDNNIYFNLYKKHKENINKGNFMEWMKANKELKEDPDYEKLPRELQDKLFNL